MTPLNTGSALTPRTVPKDMFLLQNEHCQTILRSINTGTITVLIDEF